MCDGDSGSVRGMKRTALMLLGLIPLATGLLPGYLPQHAARPQDPAPVAAAKKAATRSATIIFLRHAETLPRTRDNQNPDLSDAGTHRAKELAKALRAAGVTRIFATELGRTQQTATPLAKLLGLQLEQYSARKSQAFATTLQALPDQTVAVVVGHSNTVPQMVKQLGGSLQELDEKGYLQETEHDRMIVQVLHANQADAPMRALQTIDLRIH